MSPTQMLLRRFFRSKLSIIGLVMVIGLFVFSFLGPLVYTQWGETDLDESGKLEYTTSTTTYTVDGVEYTLHQTVEKTMKDNFLAAPSAEHPLGTDNQGYDVLARLMYGGRVSLLVSFMTVILLTVLGVIIGGIAGYFGGAIDNIIMRICDILMCLPGIPILLIISSAMDGWVSLGWVEENMRIYILMLFLTMISWPGTARLVRGQILSLREQEYMVAAEAMGFSTGRKIFKHLVPNVMPQLIVQMSLSLGSMILYEATLSYLNMGIKAPYTAWGSMINIITTDPNILQNYLNVWVPAGVCIVIAVLGFNFVGDGLRDALDPKGRR
ncbi:MAG: ABC transporter permease [Oscillospiraceae bacterium]|nr:ABC transporter permease [Oscillospiraceae bacterium]